MKVKNLLEEIEAFQDKLIRHQQLYIKSVDLVIAEYPIRNVEELKEQSRALCRTLGKLRLFLNRLRTATGVNLDFLDVATGLDQIAQIKGESLESVIPELDQIIGYLKSLDQNEEFKSGYRKKSKTAIQRKPSKTFWSHFIRIITIFAGILSFIVIGFGIGRSWGLKEAKLEEFKPFVEYLAILKRSVNLIDISLEKETLSPGDTCAITIRIQNDSPYEYNLWVGASAIGPDGSEYWNVREDEVVTLVISGPTKFKRYLTLPNSLPIGNYDIHINLWYGKVSDPKQSVLLARAKQQLLLVKSEVKETPSNINTKSRK